MIVCAKEKGHLCFKMGQFQQQYFILAICISWDNQELKIVVGWVTSGSPRLPEYIPPTVEGS